MARLPPLLEAHFRTPWRGAGADPTRVVRAENEVCGDWVELELAPGATGGLALRYRLSGCSATIAVASLLAKSVDGLSPAEARGIDLVALVEAAGGLAPTQRHALAVVLRAWTAALASAPSA